MNETFLPQQQTVPLDPEARARLKTLIDEIDRLVPKEGAAIRIDVGHSADESIWTANALGYLRGGLALMKAAFDQGQPGPDPGSEYIDCSLDELMAYDSDVAFDMFARDEDMAPPSVPKSSVIGQAIGLAVLVLLVACFVVGVVTIVQSIIQWLR